MTGSAKRLISVMGVLIFYSAAVANELSMGVLAGSSEGVIPPASSITNVSGGEFILRLHTSCYGTNLRNVANPISPDSLITTNIDFQLGDKNYKFFVKFLGALTAKAGISPTQMNVVTRQGIYKVNNMPSVYENYGGPSVSAIGQVGYYGNIIQLKFKDFAAFNRNQDGSIGDLKSVVLKSIVVDQKVLSCDGHLTPHYGAMGTPAVIPTYTCGAFMARDGLVTAQISNLKTAPDNSTVDINMSFPGQTGFCGGYYSPLMLFFSDERPLFINGSRFPINKIGNTTWVEKNSPGYFLVYDKMNNRKITELDQLFGDTIDFKNGFEKLKSFDTNKDKQISSKDKEFLKLYLWNDQNGDGISDENELIQLKKKVQSISLNYKSDSIRALGQNAEEREYSYFSYIDKKNNLKKGKIVDVWLAPKAAAEK